MYFLEKEFHFDSAHNLRDYQGDCANLHGHRWVLKVVLSSEKLNKQGMVIDFKDLKKIIEPLLPDHKYLNNFYEFNPTAENLSKHLFEQIQLALVAYFGFDASAVNVNLEYVVLYESPGAGITYTGSEFNLTERTEEDTEYKLKKASYLDLIAKGVLNKEVPIETFLSGIKDISVTFDEELRALNARAESNAAESNAKAEKKLHEVFCEESEDEEFLFPINEIFYSIQGEGINSGRPAVFIRFAGCNLKCPFCDTNFEVKRRMSIPQILTVISEVLPRDIQLSNLLVVFTGGEPTLVASFALKQLTEMISRALSIESKFSTDTEFWMETNGVALTPAKILNYRFLDGITVSPKFLWSQLTESQIEEWFRLSSNVKEIKIIWEADPQFLKRLSDSIGWNYFLNRIPVTKKLPKLFINPADNRVELVRKYIFPFLQEHSQFTLGCQLHKFFRLQ